MEDKEIKIIILTLVFCLAVFYGGLAIMLKLFPYRYMATPILAVATLTDAIAIDDYNKQVKWVGTRPDEVGLVKAEQGRYQEGVTLCVTAHTTSAALIDDEGRELHKWEIGLNDVWPEQDHILSLFHVEDKYAYFRDAHLYENGDLLAAVTVAGITPWGVGFVKLDKDSNIIWSYPGYVNNDFHVGPDGTIYMVEHMIREEKPEIVEEIFLPFLEDNILVLSPEGEFVKRFSLIDAIDKSEFRAMLKRVVFDGKGDITHSNSIEYIRWDNPDVPWIREGYLAVSVRNLNTLVILDPEKEEVVHAIALNSVMQHDIDYLANGHFMLFDNHGDIGGDKYTRVIEFDPVTQEILWQYDGRPFSEELKGIFWGEQQRLSNGNTLIVHAESGELREITREGEVVWNYFVPQYNEIEGKKMIAVVTHAERLPASYIKFDVNNR